MAKRLTCSFFRINQIDDWVAANLTELPVSKIEERTNADDVAFISPDLETSATGHDVSTISASLVRNLALNTTLDGVGIGVAVIDGSYQIDNELFRPANGTVITQVKKDIRNWNMMVTDGGGRGTHDSLLIAGNPSFLNSVAMGGRSAPFVNWQGVLVSVGLYMGEGNPNWSNAIYGDNTVGMAAAGY